MLKELTRWLGLALLAVTITLGIVACGDDDETELVLEGTFFADVPRVDQAVSNSLVLTRELVLGQNVTIALNAVGIDRNDIVCLNANIRYDGNITELIDYTPGSFFPLDQQVTMVTTVIPPDLNFSDVNTTVMTRDLAIAMCTSSGQQVPLDGNAVVLTLRYRTKSQGRTPFRFRENFLLDDEGNEVTGIGWYSGVYEGRYFEN